MTGSGCGLRLDAPTVAELATRCGVDTIWVWASGGGEDVYMRDLCARIGDPEEPASGTTSATLTAYLAYHWGRRRLQVHQGIETGRPSLIETEVHEEGTIAIRGRAVRTLRGELMLPAFACHEPGGWGGPRPGPAHELDRIHWLHPQGDLGAAPHRAPADRQPPGLLPPWMS